jgi:hypothetical protein
MCEFAVNNRKPSDAIFAGRGGLKTASDGHNGQLRSHSNVKCAPTLLNLIVILHALLNCPITK